MKITIIGTGYVGLVSGVMMSHLGLDVTCLDTDIKKIEGLKQNISPIYEPSLDDYIQKYGNTDRLKFTHSYPESLRDAEAVFIAVGTPPKENGEADLSFIYEAVENAAGYMKPDSVLVIKSTVPPGTCKNISAFLKGRGTPFEVASNPEFLREGAAVFDFINPDRIIIGTESDKALETLQKVYKPLTDKGIKLLSSDLTTSELIKYASNTFLANKIAFINEMADLCEIVDADIETLSKGIGLDKRIGPDFLKAGPGFGGSCFPKDILALRHLAQKVNADCLILNAVIKANTDRPKQMINKITKAVSGHIRGKKFAILGLTYKAGTDDLRNSPAIELTNCLKENGAEIVAYDPRGMPSVPKYFDRLELAESATDAAKGADAIIIATEWPEFKEINFRELKNLLKTPVIIDLRNILDSKTLKEQGYNYFSIGKKHDN
jgi:UDPglucose 6-dehydrogenase